MNVRCYTHTDGTTKVVTFTNEGRRPADTDLQHMDRVWNVMRARDPNIPATFLDMDPSSLPARTDVDGVPVRTQWRIVNSQVVRNPAVRNIYREIFDKRAQLAVLLAVPVRNVTQDAQVVSLQTDIDNLTDEFGNG